MFKKLHLGLLVAAVLLLSMQVLALVIYASSFFPVVWDDEFLKGLEPTRDTLFYAIFLVTNIALMVAGVKWVLPRLTAEGDIRKLKIWVFIECWWCFLIMFCFFKWTTYKYPFWNILAYENSRWLNPFFCLVFGLGLLSKIFFPEILQSYRRFQIEAGKNSFLKSYTIYFQVIFISLIAVLLYIPHPQEVKALGLMLDQWNHLDRIAAWFLKQGWFISYEGIIQILSVIAIVYIIGLFYFIRQWLNSWLLAAIGALLVVKMGLFYYGASPCIWINPANSFLAHGWDIFLFFGLWWVSIKYPQRLYPAALLFGMILMVGWLKSNGVYDAVGLDNQPMMAPLRVRQFFPFFMGFAVPIFYVLSFLNLVGQQKIKPSDARRLPMVICLYGLIIFIDYINHPMIGFYGSLMVPAILVFLWWLREWGLVSGLFVQRGIYAGILVLVLAALLTNRVMTVYPNFIFQDKDRFAQARLLDENFKAIKESAVLITQLVPENQQVVLLSNFEMPILMQAHRQALLENSPVMFSLFGPEAGGLQLITKKECLDVIKGISTENALYVFVDQRLWALSPQRLQGSGVRAILSFLNNHYTVYGSQGFIVALQRR